MEIKENNAMRSMMKTDYTDTKLDKQKELNASMTITNQSADEYTRKIKNLGGTNNA